MAATKLKDAGATTVYAMVTHGILSGPALDRITDSPIAQCIVTNTLPQLHHQQACPKLEVLDLSTTVAEAIRRTHNGESVSYLFNHALE